MCLVKAADMTEWDIKRNILKELYKNNNYIRGAREVSFEMLMILKKLTSTKYFNKNDLKGLESCKFGKRLFSSKFVL